MNDCKMNVGLVTCFLDNYGACLQAYALQQAIINTGCNCEIVQYLEPDGYVKDKTMIKRLLRNFVYYILQMINKVSHASYYYQRIRYLSFVKFRRRLKFHPHKYFTTQEVFKHPPEFDCFVCGSDQIWNPSFYNGNNLVYHLDFAPKTAKRIAYAPSVGLSKMPEEYLDEFCRLILKYDSISVREASGAKIVKDATGRECAVVLDPTLLFNKDWWHTSLQIKNTQKKEKPYIFLYLFGTRAYIGEFVEHVQKLTGMQIITIPFCEREMNQNYDVRLYADPTGFLSLISNASLVITDSFHATAFSINFNVPFYALMRFDENDPKSMNSRLRNILGLVDLESRLVCGKEDFPDQIDFDIDFTNANRLLEAKRIKDMSFLTTSIRGKQLD